MAIRRFSSSNSTKIWEHLNRLADDVEADAATALPDSDWETITSYGPNFAATTPAPLMVRLKNGRVEVRGIPTRTGGSWTDEALRICTVAEKFRPAFTVYLHPAVRAPHMVSVAVKSNGDVGLVTGYSTGDPGNGFYQCYGTYLLG